MTPFLLRTEADYTRALSLVEQLWTAEPGTPEAALLDLMAARIEAYEAEELDRVLDVRARQPEGVVPSNLLVLKPI